MRESIVTVAYIYLSLEAVFTQHWGLGKLLAFGNLTP